MIAKSPARSRLVTAAVAAGIACAAVGGAAQATRALVPHGATAARGVRIDGSPVNEGEPVRAVVTRAAAARLDRPLRIVDDAGRLLLATTARELGATVDEPAAERAA